MSSIAKDPNSLSNSHECSNLHINVNHYVDFERKIISGIVELTFLSHINELKEVLLDTKKINIKKVYEKINDNWNEISFSIGDEHQAFGRALHMTLCQPKEINTKFDLKIEYETSPDASALQWLDKTQTSGKEYPFLFSQCQAIHARSFIPCQDTPSIKFTYNAEITVPKGMTVLMSASRLGIIREENDLCTFGFEQKVPIPSYLFALFVGDLHSRKIGPRSHVWAEKDIVDFAAEEFSDTEKFISTAELIAGPYEWGFYDILVLPPSFPYGGMENPNLTTVTPTLLVGDKSNVDVVAHEISHSWTGNLVTTSNWQSFWLNEGFTVYLERKIIERIHGIEYFKFDAMLGWKDLVDSVEHFGPNHPYSALAPNVEGIDPDDVFSSIPYEKGFNLLYYLECLVGKEIFEEFFKCWVQDNKKYPVSSETFQAYFNKYFKGKVDDAIISQIDWNTWFYKPGLPPVTPDFSNKLSEECQKLANEWLSDSNKEFSQADIEKMSAKQIMLFLDKLSLRAKDLTIEKIEKMDSIYKFTESTNGEIQSRWYELCLNLNRDKIVEPTIKFITSQGRMKYVRPLYRALYNSQVGREKGIKCFKENSHFYHSICAKMIAKDLKLSE